MSKFHELDTLLRSQDFTAGDADGEAVGQYARGIADVERAIVVVSDLSRGRSRIYAGRPLNVAHLTLPIRPNALSLQLSLRIIRPCTNFLSD